MNFRAQIETTPGVALVAFAFKLRHFAACGVQIAEHVGLFSDGRLVDSAFAGQRGKPREGQTEAA